MKFTEIKLPSNKKFGYFFSLFFLIISSYFIYSSNHTIGIISAIVATLFLATTLLNADLLLPLNKIWMNFGVLLGMIISPIVLGVIFFGLFTPYSFIMSIIGRDELNLKYTKKESHWIYRSQAIRQTNFKQQF